MGNGIYLLDEKEEASLGLAGELASCISDIMPWHKLPDECETAFSEFLGSVAVANIERRWGDDIASEEIEKASIYRELGGMVR